MNYKVIMLKEQDYNPELTLRLQGLLEQNKDKRVVVVGTTCTGKSTLLKSIPSGVDMDEALWPQLSKEQKEYADSDPWTPEVGEAMILWTREKVRVDPGKPVFGTVVIASDMVVYLKISDELLKKRTVSRGVKFENAKDMQQQIEQEIKNSGIQAIEFSVG